MATVTELADRVCQNTGLATTGSDRTKVLSYLNQAYLTSVLEGGAYVSTFSKSLTSGTADYTFGTAPLDVTGVLELFNLWVDDAAMVNRPLVRVPEYEVQALRRAQAVNSTPMYYALRGDRDLLLYPTPGPNTTLKGSYLSSPPTLVESAPGAGQESTPTAIPPVFHYDVIGQKALSLAMEYENRPQDADAYNSKWGFAMERYMAYVAKFGGPSIHSVGDVGYEGPRDQDA